MSPRWAATLALFVAAVSCDSPFEPLRPAAFKPVLHSFSTEHYVPRVGGVFSVMGFPVNLKYSLGESEYLVATVTTSGGDAEELHLTRMLCGEATQCRWLSILMADGSAVVDVEEYIIAAGARVTWTGTALPHHGMAFTLGDPVRTLERIRRIPGMVSVEQAGLFTTGGPLSPAFRSVVEGGLALVEAPVAVGDGVLSFTVGDTVNVSYTASDGSSTSLQVVLTEPPLRR